MANDKVRVVFDVYKETLPANVTFDPALTYENFGVYYWYWIFDYDVDVTISIIANKGYYFARKPDIAIQDNGGYYLELTTDSLNADSTVYTCKFYNGNASAYTNVYEVAIQQIDVVGKTPTPTGQGNLITYYKVNESILSQLSQVVIVSQTSTTGVEVTDLSQYITSLRSYPFEIAASDPISIILGYSNTGISAPVANELYHSIDFGNVEIKSTNDNSNDYSATIKALLPYIGYVTLDASWYAGQTVNLTYEVDIRSGLFSANFIINGITIDIFTGKIGQDLPYKVAAQESINNWINPDIQDTYPLQASILTLYHSNLSDNVQANDSTYQSQISNIIGIGLCRIVDVSLSGAIPSDVQDDITSLLASGIIL